MNEIFTIYLITPAFLGRVGAVLFLFFVLYLAAVMPRMFHRPETKKFHQRYYAHRGLHNNDTDAPENSLKAFELAVKKIFGIELDVQLTKDNIPVVFHDYSLKRVCGVNDKICSLTYEELKKYKICNSNERIPRLLDVLKLVDGKVPIIIEYKIKWNVEHTCKTVDAMLRSYKGLYCIESFSPFGLIWYKKNHPEIMRGQLSSDFLKEKEPGNKIQYFILQNLLLNFLARPDFIAYNYHYKKNLSFLIATKLYRAKAFAWTITSQSALEESRNCFEYFIFDSFIPK